MKQYAYLHTQIYKSLYKYIFNIKNNIRNRYLIYMYIIPLRCRILLGSDKIYTIITIHQTSDWLLTRHCTTSKFYHKMTPITHFSICPWVFIWLLDGKWFSVKSKKGYFMHFAHKVLAHYLMFLVKSINHRTAQ